MLSRQERTAWTVVAVVVLAALAAAWFTAERWTPHAEPWARSVWLSITRPPPLEPGQAGGSAKRNPHAANEKNPPAAQPRKCVQGSRITYTDQTCPAGSTEQLLEPARVALPP